MQKGPVLGGAGSNVVLCKICSVLCMLEQSRVDNSSPAPSVRDQIGPIGLRPALHAVYVTLCLGFSRVNQVTKLSRAFGDVINVGIL